MNCSPLSTDLNMTTLAINHLDNLKKTLVKQFSKYENSIRIEKAINNISAFVQSSNEVYYKSQDIRNICEALGLSNLIRKATIQEQEKIYHCIEKFVLYEFFSKKCLSFTDDVFEKQYLSFSKEGCVLSKTSADFSDWSSAAGNIASVAGNPLTARLTTNKQVEINHNLEPSLTLAYQIGNLHIDEFIRNSLYLESYSKLNLNKMQKLQLIFLSKSLVSKQIFINKTLYSIRNSVLNKNGKNILSDYIDNLHTNNLKIYSFYKNVKFVPYCVELNGVAGVGKSTFVELLKELLHSFFPFYDEKHMIYNRVNDKFWNGYCQQPIILYDDCNQNEKMLFNLDNEVIAIGSGQLVHPPMAFDKDMTFGSIFVVYTTNTKLIETTHADKGAISRRIHTVNVEPKSNLGEFIEDGYGKKWQYHTRKINPYNLTFDSESPNYVISCFIEKMLSQIDITTSYNMFDDIFEDEEEEQITGLEQFMKQLDDFKIQEKCNEYYGILVVDESFIGEQAAAAIPFVKTTVDSDWNAGFELCTNNEKYCKGYGSATSVPENTDQPLIHAALKAFYTKFANTYKEHELRTYEKDTVKITTARRLGADYTQIQITNFGVRSRFLLCVGKIGTYYFYEESYLKRKENISEFMKLVLEISKEIA